MGKNREEYCRYHRTRGHSTDQCRKLRDQFEMLVRKGHIRRYVQVKDMEPRRGEDRQEERERSNQRHQKRRMDYGENSPLDNEPIHEPIHVILGDETMAGDPSSSPKISHEGTSP